MDQSPSAAKRLWHIVRVVYYMLRKGISKHKFVLELNLLLKRGKLAGKALGNLLAHHHHHHRQQPANINGGYSSFSCRSMDPNLSFYDPKEVQFSCSNTPAYPSFATTKRKNRCRHGVYDEDYDVAAIAKAFEILNSEASTSAGESSVTASPSPSPSPSPSLWTFGRRTPAAVRQLRITDSPFPLREDENGEADGHVDEEAEVFIRRFYEQLRLQQRAPETPDYLYCQRETPLSAGRGRRVG